MLKQLFLIVFCVAIIGKLYADEGMWIPMLLKNYTIEDMQKKGLKLSAEDIYSINKSSLKDAVMLFGGGCTAELVSNQGLILTNHHCGYSSIQSHSSVEHDYLTDGYWAQTKADELPNNDLSVEFLVRMEDVTQKVLQKVTTQMSEKERKSIIKENIKKIKQDAEDGTHYKAAVEPFFCGNQYFLFITEVYTDVRLVGAPPSSIGKFGGDTDNWMWPRHTGDFSVFRIYASKDNKPADYNENNVPFKPKKFLKINAKGIKKGDFTMVYGYPGRTEEYLPACAIKETVELLNPNRINLRDARLKILKKYMDTNDTLRIKYAAKYAGIANGWKKWIGENNGIKRMNGIEKKIAFEKEFQKWTETTDIGKKYTNLLERYNTEYVKLSDEKLWTAYLSDGFLGVSILEYGLGFTNLESAEDFEETILNEAINKQNTRISKFFENYNKNIDKEIFYAVLSLFYTNVPKTQHPKPLQLIESKFNGNIQNYIDYIYEESDLTTPEKAAKFFKSFKAKKIKKLRKDPLYSLVNSIINMYSYTIYQEIKHQQPILDSLQRLYMQAQIDMLNEKNFYPDANLTLRIAYGKVDDYEPKDGVEYIHYTTLKGVMEKDNPDIYDYDVPKRLKELYNTKDYGKYADTLGYMPVCFIASNHTTGGNSGSPVLNANGELIGINFDRNWEGTMSDLMYDPDYCRNIVLDIRYCLFIIDKFAKASHLVKEMDIIHN